MNSEQFIIQLLEKIWVTDNDEVTIMKADLLPILHERILLFVYKTLTPDQNDKLWILLDEWKVDEAEAFTYQCIEEYDTQIAHIYLQFEDEYINLTNN